MPISFTCGQCGKDYIVSDGLAGKRAMCKACGNRMQIPGDSAVDAVAVSAPVARSSSPSRPAAAPPPREAPRPAADDLYGLDEAPLPLPPRAGLGASPADEPEAPKKKKKKGGLFSSGGAKPKMDAGGLNVGLIVRVVLLLAAVGFGLFRTFGLSSKGEVEKIAVRQLDLTDRFSDTLRSIDSVAAANLQSAKLKEILRLMTENLEKNRNKKARQSDIDAVAQRLQGRADAAKQRLMTEMTRVAMIPGALQKLDIQAPLEKLAHLEQQLQIGGPVAEPD